MKCILKYINNSNKINSVGHEDRREGGELLEWEEGVMEEDG